MTPVITVVIDTYNHEAYIEEAILSALGQDFPRSDFEILVVDDGSTDRTPEIVRRFEPDVRLLQKANGGQASAINFGVAQAKGELVAFLDGDDLWLPTKLSRVVQEFEKEPRPVLVYHRYCFWDCRNNRTWEPDYFREVSGDVLADHRKLLAYVAAPTSSLAFRRKILERVMPVPERCSFMHDIYLLGSTISLGPVAAIGECLTRNTVHGQNLCFADTLTPSPEVLRRRVETWKAAIGSVRSWVQVNVPRSSRSKIEVLLRRWRLAQEADELRLRPPGRLRSFAHQARYNWIYGSMMTRLDLAYVWLCACAVLILGRERSHYVEAIRTRVKMLVGHLRRRLRSGEQRRQPV